MKKCPKCKAEIQEEARFCLYCMTSFEKKQEDGAKPNNKWWLYGIAAFLLVLIIALCFLLFTPKNTTDSGKDTSSPSSDDSSIISSEDSDSTPSNEEQGSPLEEESSLSGSSDNDSPSKDNNSSEDKPSSGSSTNQPTPGGEPGSGNNGSVDTSTEESTPTTPDEEDDTAPDETVVPKFSYVTATIQNAYPTEYSEMYAPENAIVITKVEYIEPSGNYVIPEKIDNKKVAAIMPSAFSDPAVSSSVKSVTLPSTVRTIWSEAFTNCYNLTDLYLKSAVIGIYEDAFPLTSMRNEKLTIHCKRDCRDFNFYYYRNIAERYDAEYEEWNG